MFDATIHYSLTRNEPLLHDKLFENNRNRTIYGQNLRILALMTEIHKVFGCAAKNEVNKFRLPENCVFPFDTIMHNFVVN
jgi:hypothetical protein